jgi:periplasmic divalent cation tolerance protein
MDTIAVLTTTGNRDEAREIAAELVRRKLAACVQISEIESYYTWEGKAQHETEYRLLAKTTRASYADVEAAILELHSYDLPGIVAVEFTAAYAPYAGWVAENSGGSTSAAD